MVPPAAPRRRLPKPPSPQASERERGLREEWRPANADHPEQKEEPHKGDAGEEQPL